MLTGSCLCKGVRFQIHKAVTDIYQCHCSLCRKSTGTGGCSVTLAPGDGFEWTAGESLIQIFKADSGFRRAFCQQCGSQVPDPNPEATTFWIPAGLLDDPDPGINVGAHIFVDSKAAWEVIGDQAVQHSAHFPRGA